MERSLTRTRINLSNRRAVGGLGIAVALTLLLVSGCNSGDEYGPAPVPAGGTVKFNGEPIDGTVHFLPNDGHPASGKIEKGKFTLSTYKDGDGAVPGEHQVAVVCTKEKPARTKGGEPEIEYVVPKSFATPGTSGLVIEIPREGKTDIDLKINTK